MSNSKTFLAICLAFLYAFHFVSKVDACPKRFRAIKFVGRTIKKGVCGAGRAVSYGARSLKTKINSELHDEPTSNSGEVYTSYENN